MSSRELGITGDMPCAVNQEGDRGPIPQQLREVIELVTSMNQRIEDCAVEWQAKISQSQWRILDSKPIDNKPWEESVLARTYFPDKILDEAFQGLLKHNKNFTDRLENFVALIRGEQPTVTIGGTSNAQNQCSELSLGDEEQLLARRSLLSSLDLSVLEKNSAINENLMIDHPDISVLNKAQESFTELIKAKIDFDTKFLGFEATLNGNVPSNSHPSINLCQICSKFLGSGVTGKGSKTPAKTYKNNLQQYKKKPRRSRRIKHKRLSSKKSMTIKNKERKISVETVKDSTQDNPCSNNQSAVTTGRI